MKYGLAFRYAVAADFADVLDPATQLALQIEADVLTAEQFETYYLRPHAPMRLLLAVNDHRTVGMICWTLTHELYSGDTRVCISDVSVHHSARGEGMGAALMTKVKAWARAYNASKLGWEVWHRNFAAKAFYERMEPPSMKRRSLILLCSGMERRDHRILIGSWLGMVMKLNHFSLPSMPSMRLGCAFPTGICSSHHLNVGMNTDRFRY